MVSSHWSNIDPDCQVRPRCYPMRMKPSWIISLDWISPQAAQIYTQIWQSFLLGGAAVQICLKICTACLHVGQMLFAGNKYLLLKRITVQVIHSREISVVGPSPGPTPWAHNRSLVSTCVQLSLGRMTNIQYTLGTNRCEKVYSLVRYSEKPLPGQQGRY